MNEADTKPPNAATYELSEALASLEALQYEYLVAKAAPQNKDVLEELAAGIEVKLAQIRKLMQPAHRPELSS